MSVSPAEMAEIGRFSVQFTFFVFMWNQAEATARRILQIMLRESETAMAVAVELGNRSLLDALRAGAKDKAFAHVRDEIEHLVVGYERLLGHRNYHVHSLIGLDGQGGILLSMSAKGSLKFAKNRSTMADLEALKNHVSDWIGFAAAIEKELGASGSALDNLLTSYGSSLQKPIWPAPHAKNAVLLQGQ